MIRWFPQSAVAVLAVLGTGLAGCQGGDALSDDSQPVARVNGEAITEAELQASLNGLFGEQQAAMLDEAGRRKALEGLVAGRAIAQRAEDELDPKTRLAIEHKVNLYRDKLLLTEYLRSHAEPEPVTDAMVQEYYRSHQDEFGGGVRKAFELVIADKKPAPDRRRALIDRLGQAGDTADWPAWSEALKRAGFAVNYRKAASGSEALDERLLNVVSGLEPGQVSSVVFIDGRPAVVRVLSEEQLAAEPLHQVSAAIRRKLMPGQLKQSIKTVQSDILEKAEIEYPDRPDKGGE